MVAGAESRKRTLTEKGQLVYDQVTEDYITRLGIIRHKFDEIVHQIDLEDEGSLPSLRKEILDSFEMYHHIAIKFMDYLKRQKTEQGELEYSSQKLLLDSMNSKLKLALERIPNLQTKSPDKEVEAIPTDGFERSTTGLSHSTNSSKVSSIVMRQKAKAEAAKVRLKFAEDEVEIMKKQAEMTVKLKLLESKRDVVEAEAELKVMNEMLEEQFDRQSKISDNLHDITKTRTEQYVKDLPPEIPTPCEFVKTPISIRPKNFHDVPSISDAQSYKKTSVLRPEALEFNPNTHNAQCTENYGISELSKYLVKKDLLLSRITQFTDKPENYLVWKTSFQSIMKDLEVTPSEELDLLSKWLGSESKRHAVSLRAANIQDPLKGITLIWQRLDDRYGAPELVEASLKERLNKFPKLLSKDTKKLYELSDLLSEIENVKENEHYRISLSYFDSSSGINPIVNKLPGFLQARWTDRAIRYKVEYSVMFPPFKVFAEFIRDMAIRMNDPSFQYDYNTHPKPSHSDSTKTFTSNYQSQQFGNRPQLSTKKTDLQAPETANIIMCPLHDQPAKHTLKYCRDFLSKSQEEKKDVVLKNGLCFKCLIGKHLSPDCQENIRCEHCNSSSHCAIFHRDKTESSRNYGGEQTKPKTIDNTELKSINRDRSKVNSKCTQICGDSFKGKSCAKIVLSKLYHKTQPEQALKAYVILDDQSNRSLAGTEFFDFFGENSSEMEYILSSCSGHMTSAGRRADGYVIESLDSEYKAELPTLIECNQIPDSRHEIPTPEVATQYKHLKDISPFIPDYDIEAPIVLLLGRDMISAHHVLDQKIGQGNEPYAQRLRLGWVIIGETCLGLVHQPDIINVNKTYILSNGRTSVLKPCPNKFELEEKSCEIGIGTDIFRKNKDDDTPGYSQEDKEFLTIMDSDFIKTPQGNWSAPLPFRKDRPQLENNYEQALNRAQSLARGLKKNPVKQEHFCQFMKNIFLKGHAEIAEPLSKGEECWYIPIFGIYHPKKPNKIRVVFDSSAKFKGHSLNDTLMTGPDLINNLIGVLINFRKERIAVTADIEQMFFNFYVHETHRNYLRFIWFKDNDPNKELVEYRMCVHVFGNSPSPAVATLGLRKSVCGHEKSETCDDICDFVNNNFYVDDSLVSLADIDSAVSLMKRTQDRLKQNGNLRLHKISSNNKEVLASFPQEDLASDVSDLDFNTESSIVQRSLGLCWNISSDTFSYQVSKEHKSYTKRGLLSTINSIFDPLGLVSPVILGGKLVLKKAMALMKSDWDELLPDSLRCEWENWRDSLVELENLKIPRAYTDISLLGCACRELHIFADASKEAVGSVAYIKLFDENGSSQLGFVLGKSKVAPSHGHTIPRLELCAAVLAVEMADFITKYISVDTIQFYTDSQVVLGYINNETRRFYVYVGNRVDRILKSSSKSQWNYVPTNLNPADFSTRPVKANQLNDSVWLKGPSFLVESDHVETLTFDLVDPDQDQEIRSTVEVYKTNIKPKSLGPDRFRKFSSWSRLIAAITSLKKFVARNVNKEGHSIIDFNKSSEQLILREIQLEHYSKEIDCLKNYRPLPRESAILKLSPILNKDGLLQVQGRINNSQLSIGEKKPLIIPGKSHIACLLVRHFHETIHHQGRHLTEGAIRSAGFWITGSKRLINSIIFSCVTCRKLRRPVEYQRMSDLPSDRLTPSPPFTYVGVDTFGPWTIITRRTRGGQANSKRWALIFSCLVTRGIHIEVIEEMTSSSFINGLRRFIALRGPVKEFRSDRGTNFIGAIDDLNVNVINVEDHTVTQFLIDNRTMWTFNAPHSSHMGGAWERMIGLVRKVLDVLLLNTSSKNLTHEVLVTFMAEVCAIINARPLVAVSTDPDNPSILSPAVLITQKYQQDVEPFQHIDIKDMYKKQWCHVQSLAINFWDQWHKQYIQTLQFRSKWHQKRPNLNIKDIVLVMDSDSHRNNWPLGIIENVYPSADGIVRKASVRMFKDNKRVTYTRPITQLVLLISE